MNLGTPIAPLDWGFAAVLGLSMLVGLWRGLVFELLSLAGWVAAWVVAKVYGPALAASLALGEAGSAGQRALGFTLAFVGTLVAASLLARLARWLVAATPLSALDRLLGAGFGLLRGLLVLLAVTTLVSLTPARHSPIWQASQGAGWLDRVLEAVRPWVPERGHLSVA